jgi:hypothetical protein
MFFLRARAAQILTGSLIAAAVSSCAVGPAAAQTLGDTVRARLRDGGPWMSGRFVRFDSVLVLDRSSERLQLQRAELVQLQAYRRRSPLVFVALGAGLALAGYQAARLIAGPDSRWACDGCGITWHEGRDYLVFGAGGIALGAIAYFVWPPQWRTVFGP